MAITRRIDEPAAPGTTPRLLGPVAADTTARIDETPGGFASPRVPSPPAGGQHSRISSLLLLEGDEDGHLLLEGDAQPGGAVLMLEGDASAFAITARATKRIAEAVA